MHRYCLVGLLFLSQSVFIQFVQAQMYQWVDPESGTTQLSGKPPAWYRSAEGGPRVFVFNRGKVVDDTGIEISDEQRNALRRNAFIRAEEDRLAAQEKAAQAAKIKAALGKKAIETEDQNSKISANADKLQQELQGGQPTDPQVKSLQEEIMSELVEAEPEAISDQEAESIAKMKALITEWENKRTEEAKGLLQ